ncbi:hypothetical protein NDN08_000580 [Rhodosorus marinus]|uniref:Sulfur carrier protein MOCS2A n=1 Tax=Rhodosorus marinus TaxID=101924 RepID=A0AAV8UND2_9RHOD|nr:hypothetical protein NDN08_000580 [Rhodosorus marinus]
MITPSPICSRSIHIEILLIVKQCFGNEVGYSLLYFNDEIEFCVQRSDEMTMIVKVLFFAKAKELCGGVTSSSFELTGPTTTCATLFFPAFSKEALVNEHILKRFPQLESIIPICVLSLNLEYVEDVRELSDGDEIALIPPISGG